MTKHPACRICGNLSLISFFDLGKQPLANALLKNPQQKEKFYPLSLSWCKSCSLVQLDYTADPKELFSEYVWVTGTSATARAYADIFYEELMKRVKVENKEYILEVASNDGTFLKPFIANGYSVLGIDPASNIVNIAQKNNIPTECLFFGTEAAQKILLDYGPAKVIFARNVLPHVANTRDFVQGLQVCLKPDGILAIEVHYAKKILKELHYDSIYHEHLCYFTLFSLEKLLNNFGLFVVDLTESPISGGSIVVYAKKYKTRETERLKSFRKMEIEDKVNDLKSWQSFAKKSFEHRHKILEILSNCKQSGQTVVGYGASARSSTLLNFCHIGNSLIKVIADQNELKQGLYTPGTHIVIKHPDEVLKLKPETILLLAWNFSSEIMELLKKKYSYSGFCIIPLPNSPRLVKI